LPVSADKYAAQRAAADDAAAICQAVLNSGTLFPAQACVLEDYRLRAWARLDTDLVEEHGLGDGAIVLATILLAVIDRRISFGSIDEFFGWLHEIGEPLRGDEA
jgi:hypothetical protein